MEKEKHVVTGAFGYSGKYIAQRLLDLGRDVHTLTNSPNRPNPFGQSVTAHPYDFDNPDGLMESLQGAAVLYNTYWVRFNNPAFRQGEAVENTLELFDAARRAGVRRVVHTSITNPSENSPLEYFSGKAKLEKALRESGLSHAILRPAVLFGTEDILVNNIAWAIRRFPVFGVFGNGNYKIQPIHVDDFAALAVAKGAEKEDQVVDAIGPETFTYRELVRVVAHAIGKRCLVLPTPPAIGYLVTSLAGRLVNDVIVTRDEMLGLMDGLLCTDSPPAGSTKLSEWAKANASELGVRYASELARRRDRTSAYRTP